MEEYIRAYPGATLVRTATRQIHYTLTPEHRPHSLRDEGPALPIAGVAAGRAPHDVKAMLDGDPGTSWSAGQSQSGDDTEAVTVDLGSARPVGAVELALGSDPAGYPRELRVESSLDGRSWAQAWQGRTAGRFLIAALEDPRRVAMRVQVDETPARYIRLRQLAADATSGWSIAELAVLGPRRR